uniref:NAD(P)(+)--arginine ADP-ribosyltransferase n=1 Tax=Callorhinchus milii TaxID=7868 RepID=A0A4W3GS53_CALMI
MFRSSEERVSTSRSITPVRVREGWRSWRLRFLLSVASQVSLTWWNGQKKTVSRERALALYAYTLETPPLYSKFTSALRDCVDNDRNYKANFPYKSLHYYLSAALEELRSSRGGGGRSITLFRGSSRTYNLSVGETKQFEMFTSSSENRTVGEVFAGDKTLFHITTTLGVSIKDYSAFPGQDEWLIPPCSPFLVTKTLGEVGRPRVEIFLSSGFAPSPTITLLITVLLTQCRLFW